MQLPEFKTEEQVTSYLRGDNDPLVMQALEEYWDIILCDTPIDEVDFEELNGWIEYELNNFEDQYYSWCKDEGEYYGNEYA